MDETADHADHRTPDDSHGDELRSCRLGDVRFSEVVMPPGLRLRGHAHGAGQIVFVLEGAYRERWPGRSVTLSPGSVIYRPPGVVHGNEFGGEPVLALLVSYERSRLERLGPAPGPRQLGPLLADLRARIQQEWDRRDGASRAALEGIALLLLSRAWRARGDEHRPAWLRAAVHLLERRWAEGISLATVAGEVGVHRATVAAGFRRHLGRSVGEMVRALRLGHALDRIRRSRRPLAEIALECGFYDQSHMGRHVRRATGATPGQLRAER